MIKKLLTFLVCLTTIFYSFSQNNSSLQGNWQLKDVVLKDATQKELSKEQSFFSFYLNTNETLKINEESLSVVVGGHVVNYSYSLIGNECIMKSYNTVYYSQKADEDVKTLNIEGTTIFNFERKDNLLILCMKNNTFYEQYTFELI